VEQPGDVSSGRRNSALVIGDRQSRGVSERDRQLLELGLDLAMSIEYEHDFAVANARRKRALRSSPASSTRRSRPAATSARQSSSSTNSSPSSTGRQPASASTAPATSSRRAPAARCESPCGCSTRRRGDYESSTRSSSRSASIPGSVMDHLGRPDPRSSRSGCTGTGCAGTTRQSGRCASSLACPIGQQWVAAQSSTIRGLPCTD
jgi:hypothetical protein